MNLNLTMMKKNLLFILTLFLCSLSYAQVETKLEIDSTDIKIRPLNTLSIYSGFEKVNPENVNLSNFGYNAFNTSDQHQKVMRAGFSPLSLGQYSIVIKKNCERHTFTTF
jgi:hypothetical protein